MPGSLETYRAKRDFTKTSEPRGSKRAAPMERSHFVIQKHDASRLHYDFRLEHDGVLKSWAVTKGPSLDPQDRRLAVEVEDHPIEYGDFEGVIPEGEYGGGTVMVWDRGWWEPEDSRSVEEGLKKGHISFRLEGKRLKGGWSLVRMRADREGRRNARNNWLLIKHDDGAARPGDGDALLEKDTKSVASGRSMEAIAAGRGKAPTPFITDARRAANAVWSSDPAPVPASVHAPTTARGKRARLTPEFVEPELARLIDRPPSGPQWIHEIKFDGYRMQLRVEKGAVTLRTRKGLDWTSRFPEIARDAGALPDCLLDGEIVALDVDGRPDFAGLQQALSSGRTGELVFFLFDALYAEGEDLRSLDLQQRKTKLGALLDAADAGGRLRFVEHFEASGQQVLDAARRLGLEGVVSKRLDSPYRSGRGHDWVKSKCRDGQEVVIGGWTTTDGNAFRSILAGVWRDGRLVPVGRVGSGFGAGQMDRLLPRLKALETKASPFSETAAPRKTAAVHWVRPELVAEIEFAGWTADGQVRQASFKGLREDRPASEVRMEKPEPVKTIEPETPASRRRSATGGDTVLGVSISNPDKALWPEDKQGEAITKLELARYYESVATWLLPYVQGRPCTIIRIPDGIDGERFIQRHAGAGTSPLITLAKVSGDRTPYLQFDTPEALIAAAQSGAAELHPWNSLPGKPDLPGRFVFDLDPDENLPFERVIAAAFEVRDRLKRVGLESFLKTTGGKGLHVVTPFAQSGRNPVTWPEAKTFAQALCVEMAADTPNAFTTNMAKRARPGKIFLDYLRNDRMASAVAVLSPRARPGAPVSMPVAWPRGAKGLDPKAFTVRTAPARMRKRDPWAGLEEAAQPLAAAIRKLGGAH
jgi:bifunctional non-homologous end joining protein LigD